MIKMKSKYGRVHKPSSKMIKVEQDAKDTIDMFKSEKASIKKRISKSIQILEEISFSKDTISIKPEKTTNKRKIKHHSSRPAKRASMISSDHESVHIEDVVNTLTKLESPDATTTISTTKIFTTSEIICFKYCDSASVLLECCRCGVITHEECDKGSRLKSNADTTIEFTCSACFSGEHRCFLCDASPSVETRKCPRPNCCHYYHDACALSRSHLFTATAKAKSSKNGRKSALNAGGQANGGGQAAAAVECSQHRCRSCTLTSMCAKKPAASDQHLMRCLRCPNAFHNDYACLPAGSEQRGASRYVVCGEHTEGGPERAASTWCELCFKVGGSLVWCTSCPIGVHVKCLNKKSVAEYRCDNCRTGGLPKYGSINWVKSEHSRWWPCQIYHQHDVPSMVTKPPGIGYFVVKEFGTNNYFWTNKQRIIPFVEDHETINFPSKKNINEIFKNAIQAAVQALTDIETCITRDAILPKAKLSIKDDKPPQYRSIKVNYPIGGAQIYKSSAETPICDCSKNVEALTKQGQLPCDEGTGCINRLMNYECEPTSCHPNCTNQRMMLRKNTLAEPYKCEGRGWGLKLLQDIKQNAFTFEYIGDLIDDEECEQRLQYATDHNISNFYMLRLDAKRTIDAGPKANVSRFINHSCDPNCVAQKWHVNGDVRIGIFASRDIAAGEELTFDYNFDSLGNDKLVCRCGSTSCSGFLGVTPKKDILLKKNKTTESSDAVQDIDKCFKCNLKGETMIECSSERCNKVYHLTCLNLTSEPIYQWYCPVHFCNDCCLISTYHCTKCTNSYCDLHFSGCIVSTITTGAGGGLVCIEHHRHRLHKDSEHPPSPPSPTLALSSLYAKINIQDED